MKVFVRFYNKIKTLFESIWHSVGLISGNIRMLFLKTVAFR